MYHGHKLLYLIKVGIKEMKSEDVEWFQLTLDSVHWQALVKVQWTLRFH
jgi:hypothetical protein